MKVVNIIGIGMGNPATLTLWAKETIENCTFLIGAKRMVEGFAKEGVSICNAIRPEEICEEINKRPENENIAVLMSGDVGFFSGTKKLKAMMFDSCDNAYVNLIPGISSLQYFAAMVGTSWDDARVFTLHGREGNPVSQVLTNKKTFILLSKDNTPSGICKELTDSGLGELEVFVGTNLSYDEEFIFHSNAEQIVNTDFDPLSVMLIINPNGRENKPAVHGILDEEFVRGKVPMTKEEVRSISISKLRIEESDVIYDIGAGTGSVSIEMALQATKGFVYAIETNQEAVELLNINKAKFGLQNLSVISGMAPKALLDLPVPTKAFIGGSKGNLEEIFRVLLEKNPNVRITVNAIALETLAEALRVIKVFELENVDIVQVATTKVKKIGSYNMMNGQNPVFVITCGKK
ncbi:MAG: precorrin-6y C5,15-methyltransferase (decarboxylating) subunit CbiE [Anaerovoracaceae bacterium]